MRRNGDTIATVLMCGAALTVAAVAVLREVPRGGVRGSGPPPSSPPAFVKGWEQLATVGRWIGDSNAKVRIVEFADFECPFCRRFHDSYLEASKAVGKDVALLFVQFPLSIHKFARPAAIAAECAAEQNRFGSMHDALFEKQDSFGLRSWTAYAIDGGIRDTVTFGRCVAVASGKDRIDSAVTIGNKYELRGTPTILINGWRYSIPPYDSLTTIVKRMLKGNA
jgi:protein-disulfide isomerase